MSMTVMQEALAVSNVYIPAKDELGPDKILEALREAVFENPRLREMPAEEVARQLVLDGRLQQGPSPKLVAEKLEASGPKSKASRPTNSQRRVIPLNDGNYSVWPCVSNAVLVPLRHHSLRKLSFRNEEFSEIGFPARGLLGN